MLVNITKEYCAPRPTPVTAPPMTPQIPLLNPVEIQPIVIVRKAEPPKEPTLNEKITSNYYKCDTLTQYIRADNAECLAKPIYSAPIAQNTAKAPQNVPQDNSSGNTYSRFQYGWCTYLASQLRPDLAVSGNAADWIRWSNGTTPRVGAIAVNTQGYGHVAYVLQISGDKILVRHMNWAGFGVTSDDWISLSYWSGYIY